MIRKLKWLSAGAFAIILTALVIGLSVGSFRVEQWSDANIQALSNSLLPLFALPNGRPLGPVPVKVESDTTCAVGGVSAYATADGIVVCAHSIADRRARMIGLLKHELVHVWIARAGIHDNASHGKEFMEKATEVGTLPFDLELK
jgi:hypothetical protein